MSQKILYLASEVAPFSKTGGLGDVANALPKALRALGHDVTIVTPRYRGITDEAWGIESAAEDLGAEVGGFRRGFALRRTSLPGTDVRVLFIEHNEFFDREGIYNAYGTDYPDNAERMSFFAMAALEAVRALGWRPDVVHANDWQTALGPTYLKTLLAEDPFFAGCKTVYTIHNLAYQGNFSREKLPAIGLDWQLFTHERIEFFGRVSFMKAGLVFADVLTTVSPTYAKEIQTEAFGEGLDGMLRSRAADLHGVLNGVDYDIWSPEVDKELARRYSVRDVAEGKKENGAALRAATGLAAHDGPVIGVITRLIEQKGLDILLGAMPDILATGASVVVLGSGEAKYQDALIRLATDHPGRVAVTIGYDEVLAHKIQAGADMLAVPSRFEPSGLTQLYALRYGTVPIVRRTGGLADSVVNATPKSLADGTATGFVFDDYSVEALGEGVRRAVKTFADRKAWEKLVRAGMAQDFSWEAAARRYAEIYRERSRGTSAAGVKPKAKTEKKAAASRKSAKKASGRDTGAGGASGANGGSNAGPTAAAATTKPAAGVNAKPAAATTKPATATNAMPAAPKKPAAVTPFPKVEPKPLAQPPAKPVVKAVPKINKKRSA